MKITSKRAAVILSRFNELKSLAEQFTDQCDIRFDKMGNIECEINTGCHCYPEYEWRVDKTAEEFGKWLDERAKSNS